MSRILESIYDWHKKGTLFGIRVDETDGLLTQGEDGVQLTWMDAKVGDWVVTPRHGKPVEINALWINALKILEWLAAKFESNNLGSVMMGSAADYRNEADLATSSFSKSWVIS
jgi:predicted glycogen debranching enzyme